MPAIYPQAAKKKKKTIAQTLKIVSLTLDLSSSSSDLASSRSGGLAQALEDNSSSLQLDTINPGTDPSQPQPEFIGLRVVNEPEEEEDMNNLRIGFFERHRKWLHEAIDIVPPPAKRACPEKAQEDPAGEAPPSTMPQSDEAGPSTATMTQPDVAGPSAAVAVQPNVVAPRNTPIVEKVHGTEVGLDVVVNEGAPNEKSSLAPAAPPSWEELMEILKGVSYFTDAEAPSTKMFDFFPLTKRVSVNMGGDPLAFVLARLSFGTPESVVSCI